MCEIGYVFTPSERAGAKATCGVDIQSFISHGYSAIIIIAIDTNHRNINSVRDDSIICGLFPTVYFIGKYIWS